MHFFFSTPKQNTDFVCIADRCSALHDITSWHKYSMTSLHNLSSSTLLLLTQTFVNSTFATIPPFRQLLCSFNSISATVSYAPTHISLPVIRRPKSPRRRSSVSQVLCPPLTSIPPFRWLLSSSPGLHVLRKCCNSHRYTNTTPSVPSISFSFLLYFSWHRLSTAHSTLSFLWLLLNSGITDQHFAETRYFDSFDTHAWISRPQFPGRQRFWHVARKEKTQPQRKKIPYD